MALLQIICTAQANIQVKQLIDHSLFAAISRLCFALVHQPNCHILQLLDAEPMTFHASNNAYLLADHMDAVKK